MNFQNVCTNVHKYVWLVILSAVVYIPSCKYSFKGISIPPDVRTFYIDAFVNSTAEAPGDISQRFEEALRTKIRNESRLRLTEEEPDIIFSGSIESFTNIAEAQEEGSSIPLMRLTITVKINFENTQDEKENWSQSFNFFRTYDATSDFLSIQDQLIEEIFNQLTENIFNKAFTNW